VDKTRKWKNTYTVGTCLRRAHDSAAQKEGNFAAHFPRHSRCPARHNLRMPRAFDLQSCAPPAFCNHFIAFVPQTAPGQPILRVCTYTHANGFPPSSPSNGGAMVGRG